MSNRVFCNAAPEPLAGLPLFVILDVYGSYYLAPSFRPLDQGVDFYEFDYPPGETVVTVIPEFLWPAGVGSAAGLIFYSALTDPGVTALVGSLGQWEFAFQ